MKIGFCAFLTISVTSSEPRTGKWRVLLETARDHTFTSSRLIFTEYLNPWGYRTLPNYILPYPCNHIPQLPIPYPKASNEVTIMECSGDASHLWWRRVKVQAFFTSTLGGCNLLSLAKIIIYKFFQAIRVSWLLGPSVSSRVLQFWHKWMW